MRRWLPITRIGQSYLFVGRNLRVFFKGKVGETGQKDRERHHLHGLRARIHDCGAEYLFARESTTAVLSTFGSVA